MSEKQAAPAKSPDRPWVKPVALVGAVVLVMVLAKAFGLGEKIVGIKVWIEGLGFWGPVVFVLIYSAATVAALPGSALTVAAGALFGSVLGTIVVSVASTLGASLAFLAARYVAKDSVEAWLARSGRLSRLDAMTSEHGVIIVAITRLVPLFPFNLLNYGFGLTRVRFVTYVVVSWICMLPGTVLFVVGADAVARAVSEGRAPWVLVGVIAAAVAVLAGLGLFARKHLGRIERVEGQGTTAGDCNE